MSRVYEFLYEGNWWASKRLAHLLGKNYDAAIYFGFKYLKWRRVLPKEFR